MRAAEPEAAEPGTTKRAMSGIEVVDSVSMSMSIGEMSLSSMRVAAAAQELLVGLPMLNRWTIAAKGQQKGEGGEPTEYSRAVLATVVLV